MGVQRPQQLCPCSQAPYLLVEEIDKQIKSQIVREDSQRTSHRAYPGSQAPTECQALQEALTFPFLRKHKGASSSPGESQPGWFTPVLASGLSDLEGRWPWKVFIVSRSPRFPAKVLGYTIMRLIFMCGSWNHSFIVYSSWFIFIWIQSKFLSFSYFLFFLEKYRTKQKSCQIAQRCPCMAFV